VTSIRVCCRFRPVNSREKEEAAREGKDEKDICPIEKTELDDGVRVKVSQDRGKPFNFVMDDVFWTNSTQEEVFKSIGLNTCKDVIKGYNGTILAYGQTGSGKTYSMYGPEEWNGKPISKLTNEERMEHIHHIGILPRCMNHIFSELKKPGDNRSHMVKVSSIEIYVDALNDLLNFKTKKKDKEKLRIRQLPDGSTFVSGVLEVECRNNLELMEHIIKANKNRTVSATKMNATSSRSHSIVQIFIEQRKRDGTILNSKLNFVDLAGSEKVKKTGAVGQTLREAKKINKTLLTLGSVINALSTNSKFIPFRDSDLTYLLKDSLGGNTKTNLIICCSPHIWNVNETISTLKFGTRCKLIKNTVKKNMELSRQELMNLVQQLRAEIRVLQQKLASGVVDAPTTDTISHEGLNSLKEEIQRLRKDNEKSEAALKESKKQYASLQKELGKETNQRLSLVTDITLMNAKFAHELKEKDEEIAALTLSLKELKDVFKPLEPEIEQKESELSKLQLGMMQGDIENQELALKKMHNAMQQKNAQIGQMLAQQDILRKDKSKQMRRNISLMDKLRDKDNELQEYDNRCANMEHQNESLLERIEELEAEIDELREGNELATGKSSSKQFLLEQQKYLNQMSPLEEEEEEEEEVEDEKKEGLKETSLSEETSTVAKDINELDQSIDNPDEKAGRNESLDFGSQKLDDKPSSDDEIDLVRCSLSIKEKTPPEKWDVVAVCAWLKSINLGMYCDIFRENEVDGKLLIYTSFTDHMLKSDLGIKALHVQKLRREMEVLKIENSGRSSTLRTMSTIIEELKDEESIEKKSQPENKRSPSDDGLDLIRREFDAMDADGNGQLDIDELKLGLHNLNIKASSRIVEKVFKQLDIDNSGTVEEHELVWWLGKYVVQDPEATAQQIFDRALTEIVEVGDVALKRQNRDTEESESKDDVDSDSKRGHRPSMVSIDEDEEKQLVAESPKKVPRTKSVAGNPRSRYKDDVDSQGRKSYNLLLLRDKSLDKGLGAASMSSASLFKKPTRSSSSASPKKSRPSVRKKRSRPTVEGLNKIMSQAGMATPPAHSKSLDCVGAIQDAGNGGKIKRIRFWINEDETLVTGLQVTYITSQWKEKNSDAFISDEGGQKHTEVSILPNDYIVHVLVTENKDKEISSLTIVTNRQKTYEVCDTSNMTNSVSLEAPKGFAIVGFFGTYNDRAINSLGCYSCAFKRVPRKAKSLSAGRRSTRKLNIRRHSSINNAQQQAVSWLDSSEQHRKLRVEYEADIKETLKRLGCHGDRDLENATQIVLTKYSEVQVKKFVSGGVGTRKFEQQVMREIWREITTQSSRRRRRSKR